MLTDPLLEQAFQHYKRGDLATAEAMLASLPDHPSALHLLGVLRVRQGRLPEAADLLARSVAVQPQVAQSQFNLGKVLNTLGRQAEAAEALRIALALDPALAEAAVILGRILQVSARFPEAVEAYERYLALCPNDTRARIALANALIAAGDARKAEELLLAILSGGVDHKLQAGVHEALMLVYRKREPVRALDHLHRAQMLDPSRGSLEADRALLLEELHRFDDAKSAYETILDREPVNSKIHYAYNELLYRLGEEEGFLASYDRAPRTQGLMLGKASLLLNAGRHEEAERCYRDALTRYSANREAELGLGLSLVKGGRAVEAVKAFEQVVQRYPDCTAAYCNLAGALAQSGDPQAAAAVAAKALEIEPNNQVALAMLGTAWRLMGDDRDEVLNGYDDFIQLFDLEPPQGFSDMASFNAELSARLDDMHPPVREYLGQSLRGGTQTSDNLFEGGHVLVQKLQSRVAEALDRYISGLKHDPNHPYLSRKGKGFRFAGSWSSKLRGNGFHINHLHPGGWISSCYYVDLPEAVNDHAGQQGWIKFGEPSFVVGLAPRRAIQPVPGRLVLFPSYMWHGTVPFHDRQARTTVAFDVTSD